MKLKRIILENYKGFASRTAIELNDLSCIVGKNDVGKSTILKALDLFLNENSPSIEDRNTLSSSNEISIELQFDFERVEVTIDDSILVTFEDEELTSSENLVCIRKVWTIAQKISKPSFSILRKVYEQNDFFDKSEKELIALCKSLNIETKKANGDTYNNREKRAKLREYLLQNNVGFKFDYMDLPTTGQGRQKKILDCLKSLFPSFEYFRADSSLSDSDTSVQKYFKEIAFKLLREQVNTEIVENAIKEKISSVLETITNKINAFLPEEEQLSASIDFDWSKLVSTKFQTQKEETNVPLSSRGDGIRRITMMSYFEMLAEEHNNSRNIIFGFEEPETFLHPSMQKALYFKLSAMVENGYQVLMTTHSPNIVAEAHINDLIFVYKEQAESCIKQGDQINVPNIIKELGINSDDKLFQMFSSTKLLLLVEGPDDIKAYTHVVNKYKEANLVEQSFEELGVVFIPIGGCGSIKHWTNFDVVTKLGKPYYIILDSDKKSDKEDSKNYDLLVSYGCEPSNFHLTRKREIECYIPPAYFMTITDPITDIEYGDYDDVKEICKRHTQNGRLGGKNVCERHFCNLSIAQLRQTFCPNGKNEDDEFLEIYSEILKLL